MTAVPGQRLDAILMSGPHRRWRELVETENGDRVTTKTELESFGVTWMGLLRHGRLILKWMARSCFVPGYFQSLFLEEESGVQRKSSSIR
jgi:hypothetical protein